MPDKITKGDFDILLKLSYYRFLTVKQLSFLCHRATQIIRRRLRSLEGRHLVLMWGKSYGKGKGRPENVAIPTKRCFDLLSRDGHLPGHITPDADTPPNPALIDHDLLLNWFIIHLLALDRKKSGLVTDHRIGRPTMDENAGGTDKIIPDAVFTITHKEADKTLLFFVEVDMGTETIASANRNHKDIRQKVVKYQNLFRSNDYKHFESVFSSELNGFRLLFLSNTVSRMKSLCSFVKNMPPSNFIWIMDQDQMFRKGLFGNIWVKGGLTGKPLESIIGKELSFDEPVIDKIK
jgi:hypothetical protein